MLCFLPPLQYNLPRCFYVGFILIASLYLIARPDFIVQTWHKVQLDYRFKAQPSWDLARCKNPGQPRKVKTFPSRYFARLQNLLEALIFKGRCLHESLQNRTARRGQSRNCMWTRTTCMSSHPSMFVPRLRRYIFHCELDSMFFSVKFDWCLLSQVMVRF